MHNANRVEEVLVRAILQQKGGCAGLEGADDLAIAGGMVRTMRRTCGNSLRMAARASRPLITAFADPLV